MERGLLFAVFLLWRRSAAHFSLFVLRVQGADGCFPRPLSAEEEAKLLKKCARKAIHPRETS